MVACAGKGIIACAGKGVVASAGTGMVACVAHTHVHARSVPANREATGISHVLIETQPFARDHYVTTSQEVRLFNILINT